MLEINCPYCGPRFETEFSYGGEAHIERPKDSENLTDEEWGDYVFMNSNTKGVFLERWVHTSGCRRWFNVARDTVTYQVLAVYETGGKPPKLDLRKDV